jgi:uncharacterized protein involved in type VI secretion and phage assembly
MNLTPAQMIKDGMTPQERLGGIYRGWCVDNNDPDKRGRLKVYIPFIHDEDYRNDTDRLPWTEYMALDGGGNNYGFVFIPNKGDTVWITFINGEYQYPVWVGTWYGSPNGQTEIPKEAQTDYPEVRIIKTRSGHYLKFVDKSGKESVEISDKNGNSVLIDSTKNDMDITVNGDLTVNVSGDCNFLVGGQWKLKADGGMVEETPGQLVHKAVQIQNNSYGGI